MSEPPSPADDRSNPTSASESIDEQDEAALEQIDWDSVEPSGRWLTLERALLVTGLVALAAVFRSHRADGGAYLVMRWNVDGADWLLMLSLVTLFAYGLVPIARNPKRTKRLLARLARRWPTVLSVTFLIALLGIALYAIVTGFQPRLTLETGTAGPDRFQPPLGFGGPYVETMTDCVGSTDDAGVTDRTCYGSWTYLLGTDRWGYRMRDLLIVGTGPVVYATFVTLGLIVPMATVVGLLAGYYGGLVDDLLMSYVDVQLSVPAIMLYLIAYMFVGNSMFVLLTAFGLLSWGGIARIVRSETLQRREEGYVLSARAIGAPNPYVLRRHLLPNVTTSIVPASFHMIAVLVLTEAGLSFLGFHVTHQSWGMTIARGLFNGPPLDVWWNSTLPAIALALTVAAIKITGDGLRDALDPRGEP